jgi:cell division protein ZapA (FtsZ GTPase activity inhibitor)
VTDLTPNVPPTVEAAIHLLGRTLKIQSSADPELLDRSVALLEKTFQDMEHAYELRWGCSPSALDTSTWVLMGALNLAHQVVRVQQEASQQTQNLEQTLKLLEDVPDEPHASGALFEGQD